MGVLLWNQQKKLFGTTLNCLRPHSEYTLLDNSEWEKIRWNRIAVKVVGIPPDSYQKCPRNYVIVLQFPADKWWWKPFNWNCNARWQRCTRITLLFASIKRILCLISIVFPPKSQHCPHLHRKLFNVIGFHLCVHYHVFSVFCVVFPFYFIVPIY